MVHYRCLWYVCLIFITSFFRNCSGDNNMLLPQPFPTTSNSVAPEPSDLVASSLKDAPLPTNAAWLNFILNQGSNPEYIHPYLIKSQRGGISIGYPRRVVQANYIYQEPTFDLTFMSSNAAYSEHVVTYFDDLSVTLQFEGGMTVPLVRGSPYITLVMDNSTGLQISTIHGVLQISPNENFTKHKVSLNNGQTWLIYSSDPLPLSSNLSVNGNFQGLIRIAFLPGFDDAEVILDRYCSAYPVQGFAHLSAPFQITYEYKKRGWGELLMLSLPIHRDIMSYPPSEKQHPSLIYRSMDGDMHGVVGDSWILDEIPISIGWYSSKGIDDLQCKNTIATVLEKEVAALTKITTDSTYFYGKSVARAARFALIAEEVGATNLIKSIRDYLDASLSPWMNGSFEANGFLYDLKWGGLTSKKGSVDAGADFGFALYNDHHYHLGYFCYAGAVLAKLDPMWGMTYKSHLYTLVQDYMTFHHHHIEHPRQGLLRIYAHAHHRHTVVTRHEALFPRFRNFDFWVLHSWAGGLTEFADGRNQESTSEAVNAYYSAALLGLAFGDTNLVNAGLSLAAFEMRAARGLWHVPENSTLYEREFVANHRILGVLWANKRDTGLWFAPAEWRDRRLGINLLPILPVTEILFQDVKYVKELVEWTLPSLNRADVGDGWKGFVYALQAMYDPEQALQNVSALADQDDGNSLSNMLWWIYSRWSWHPDM